MTRMRIIPLLFAIFTQTSQAETWIAINKEPMRLKHSTKCSQVAHSDQSALCDCCIIKKSRVKGMSSLEAISRCMNAHGCSFVADSSKNETSANYEIRQAEHRLKSMSIVDVEKLSQNPALPLDGVLNSDDVLDILYALQDDGYLPLPDGLFTPTQLGKSSLVIKPLGERAKGVFSGQLFFIGYDLGLLHGEKAGSIKPLYILKETKKGISEIEHLYQINVSPLGNEKIDTRAMHFGNLAKKTSPTIAKIAFDDLHFKIRTHGQVRYFSLLQTAPGKSINKHLREFGKIASASDVDNDNFQQSFKRMKHIFYRMGFSMSELHQKYAYPLDRREKPMKRTFTHGDLHSENIFYDDVSDEITLIDCETFVLSFGESEEQGSIGKNLGIEDIIEFYTLHTIHTIAHTFSPQLTTNDEFGIDDHLWHELFRAMFDGYLSAYGHLSRAQYLELYQDFRAQFMHGLSQARILRSPRNILDQRQLKRIGTCARRHTVKRQFLPETFNRLWMQHQQESLTAPLKKTPDL